MKPIRVMLVDDHVLVRAGIAGVLQDVEGVEVIAQASDGRTALTLIAKHMPDVVFMDISMPDITGLEVTMIVTQEFPSVRVIMLSAHTNEVYVSKALQAGAMGYLLKDADVPELELAIRTVLRGESYLTPAISKQVIDAYLQRSSQHREAPPKLELTPRQREILQMVAQGRTTQEIASALFISPKTVHAHRSQMMQRLSIADVAGLIRYALLMA